VVETERCRDRKEPEMRALRCIFVGCLFAAPLFGAGSAEGASAGVSMTNTQFVPREVTIRPGDAVTWTNPHGGMPHTVTADDGSFDSSPGCGASGGSCMAAGSSFSHAFGQAGRFPYYCKLHGGTGGRGMSGVVVVQ
jgi:plastocyanin